jgi:tetratricopeptide (TPR) repeat protein
VGRDDWARSSDWDASAQAEFTERLGKARRWNRVQYRRIKAIALIETGDEDRIAAAGDMLQQNVQDPDAASFERVIALSQLGRLAFRAGSLDEAEKAFRGALQLLAAQPSGGSDLEEVLLAEVLLERGDRGDRDEAMALVAACAAHASPFPVHAFEVGRVGAKVALAVGQREIAAQYARSALEASGATESGLAHHPSLGLVELDAQMRAWLSAVAAG